MIPHIRPAKPSDLPFLLTFAKEVGYGFTSMPPHEEILKEKLSMSIEAFKDHTKNPGQELYLFVLEIDGKPVGSSGIVARLGVEDPFYAFKIESERQQSSALHIDRKIATLHLDKLKRPTTEIGSLFIDRSYRHRELGLLLSFGRFLFMAAFRSRFAPIVIAELRGFIDERGNSPFWSAIGAPFFGMSLIEATEWRYHHPECIEELFPKHPIYSMLLPKEAQEKIRALHPKTVPAMKLLENQGFQINAHVDLFDGGPHVSAQTDEIASIKQSRCAPVAEVREGAIASTKVILTNEKIDFRATVGLIEEVPGGGVIIQKEMADCLGVKRGESVRVYPL